MRARPAELRAALGRPRACLVEARVLMVVREEVALLLAKDVPFHLRQHILEEDFHARPCDRVKVIDKVGPFERLK